MIRSTPWSKPGRTNPPLRPEAFQATWLASSTATDQPRSAISRAVVRPASPPPTTQTSTSRSCVSGARGFAATLVASYQLDPYFAAFPIMECRRQPPFFAGMLDFSVNEIDLVLHAQTDAPTPCQIRVVAARQARPGSGTGPARPSGRPHDRRVHGAPCAPARPGAMLDREAREGHLGAGGEGFSQPAAGPVRGAPLRGWPRYASRRAA